MFPEMFPWMARKLRLPALPRRPELDERAAVLVLFGRFVDEVASGVLLVLMPVLRRRLGLSVTQVGWCFQALHSVAAVVEPVSGAAIDVVRRRPLLVWEAFGWAGALLLAAGAPSFGWLVGAFALAGAASGPLAHTADVVLIEAHPGREERIQSRSTTIDTVGALLAPAAVALFAWAGFEQRLLLAGAGAAIATYGVALAGAIIPGPGGSAGRTGSLVSIAHGVRPVAGRIASVLGDPTARRWLLALVLHELLDLPELFEPVWLREVVGLSQGLVAVHVALGMVATLLGLLLVDRWLARGLAGPVLRASLLGTVLVYPLWLLLPGTATRLLLVVPRNLVMAPLWPILRARALGARPGAAGTVSALSSLTGLLPLVAVLGAAANRWGLTAVLLSVTLAAVVALAWVVRGTSGPGARSTGDRAP